MSEKKELKKKYRMFLTAGVLCLLCVFGGCSFAKKNVPRQESAEVSKTEIPKQEETFLYYGYSLCKEQAVLYDEIYTAIKERTQKMPLSCLEPEEVDLVFRRVMADHPELFYIDGYTLTSQQLGDKLLSLTFSGEYTKTPEEEKKCLESIEAYEEACFAGLYDGMSDYEKAKHIYEYVIGHTEYETDALDSQNICSVFLNGKSVCKGYAYAMQYLLQKQKIPAYLVEGSARGTGHAWLVVKLSGEWYHMDPTWSDASYFDTDQEEAGNSGILYGYFGITTEEILRTHTFKYPEELPLCTATECSYYKKEDLYLKEADLEQVKEICQKAREEGRETVSFQCENKEIFDALKASLVDEMKIFDCLGSDVQTVAHSLQEELYIFTFW